MNTGWAKRGTAALEAMAQEEKQRAERAERGFMPFRLWLAQGEECEVIILDDAFVSDEEGVGGLLIREHNLKGPDGKWGTFESCCADFAPCALCDKAGTDGYGNSNLVVMLTVLALKPWTSTKSGEVHTFSKFFLPVKMGQKEQFLALQKQAFKENGGSMRGMYLVMRRAVGEQTINTGEPIMLENGKLYDFVSEEELVRDYGGPPIYDRTGKKLLKPENDDIEPYDYAKYFPQPDPADLAKRFGGRALPGSRRTAAADWEAEQKAADTSADAAAEAAPTTGRRRRGAEPAAAEAPAPTQQATAPQQSPPARRRGAAAGNPPPEPEPAKAGPVRRRSNAAPVPGSRADVW